MASTGATDNASCRPLKVIRQHRICGVVLLDHPADESTGLGYLAGPRQSLQFAALRCELDGPDVGAIGLQRMAGPSEHDDIAADGSLPQLLQQSRSAFEIQADRPSYDVRPVGTLKLLANVGRHAQLDGIGVDDLYNLGRLGLSVDPANVRNVVVPISSSSGTRLSLGPGAGSLFADFADDAVLQTH
jgi:hypothetical protein